MSVYFAKNMTAGYIKIGYSLTPPARVAALQTSSADPIELVGVISDGSIKLEKQLHERFKHARVKGEWFVETNELEDLIKQFKVAPWTKASVDDCKDQLTKLRLEKKFTLKNLGIEMNMTQQSVSDMEQRFRKKTITLASIEKYANALGFTAELKFNKIEK